MNKIKKYIFWLFFFVGSCSLNISAMDSNWFNLPVKNNGNIKQIVTSIRDLGANKQQQLMRLREAASLLFLNAQLYNLYSIIIPLSLEVLQTQEYKFLDKDTSLFAVAHVISDEYDAKDKKVWTGINEGKQVLYLNDPEYISLSLLLRDFLVKPDCITELSQFPLFNSLMDYYEKGTGCKQLTGLLRYIQHQVHLDACLKKQPLMIAWLVRNNIDVRSFLERLMPASVIEKMLPHVPSLTNTCKNVIDLFAIYLQADEKSNYLDRSYSAQLINVIEGFQADHHQFSFYQNLYEALKKEFFSLGGNNALWVYPLPIGAIKAGNHLLPEHLVFDHIFKLKVDAQSNQIITTDELAKQALQLLLKRHRSHNEGQKTKSQKPVKKHKKKKEKVQNAKLEEQQQDDLEKQTFVQESEEMTNTLQESLVVSEPAVQSTEEQPHKKEKKKKEGKSEITTHRTPAHNYDPRVLKWFDNTFAKRESFESVMYHSFSQFVDNYLFTYGHAEERANATRTGQKDTSYKLVGEIVFKGKSRRHVIFHATKDPQGICYHRGFEWKPDNLFNIFGELNFWNVSPTYNPNSLARIHLGSYFEVFSNKPDEVIKETAFHVEIRDNRLGVTIILYKA